MNYQNQLKTKSPNTTGAFSLPSPPYHCHCGQETSSQQTFPGPLLSRQHKSESQMEGLSESEHESAAPEEEATTGVRKRKSFLSKTPVQDSHNH